MIKAKSQFKRRSTANNVEIIIPVPSDADTGRFKATCGAVKYVPEKNSMVWSIKSFPVSFYCIICPDLDVLFFLNI
jgi:AP-1 complex subunit mu